MRKTISVASLTAQKPKTVTLTLALVLTFASQASFSAGMTLGPGTTFELGNGNVDMNCLDLTVSGQFFAGEGRVEAGHDVLILSGGAVDGGSSEIRLSGDWSNSGAFNPGSSSVQIEDGCGRNTSAMIGDSTFFSFEVTTSNGRTLQPVAGSSQVFQDSLVLVGAPGNQLKIRSSNSGAWAFFTLQPGGTQLIERVDAKDNNASGGRLLAPGSPAASQSVNSGNVLNWFDILTVIDEIFSDSFEGQN